MTVDFSWQYKLFFHVIWTVPFLIWKLYHSILSLLFKVIVTIKFIVRATLRTWLMPISTILMLCVLISFFFCVLFRCIFAFFERKKWVLGFNGLHSRWGFPLILSFIFLSLDWCAACNIWSSNYVLLLLNFSLISASLCFF